MCLAVIDPVIAADAPGNRTASHSRELVDMALRCSIKLKDGPKAFELAEKSKEYVRGPLSP